jgi:hypothetical protein
MRAHSQVRVLHLNSDFLAPKQQPEPSCHLGPGTPENHYTCLLRAHVNLHVKQPAEHIKHIRKLLHFRCTVGDKSNIISIHNVRDPQPMQHRSSPRALELDKVVQKLNKQAKQDRAKLTALFSARCSVKRITQLPTNSHLRAHPVIQRHQQLHKLAVNAQLAATFQEQVSANLVECLPEIHKHHVQQLTRMLGSTSEVMQGKDGIQRPPASPKATLGGGPEAQTRYHTLQPLVQ